MINNTHKITKQQRCSILKQIVSILGCFYFCTASGACETKLSRSTLKKSIVPDKTLYDTNDKSLSRDYNDLDKILYELKNALPPSYKEVTDADVLPSYEKATGSLDDTEFIEQLLKHNLDLNGWNTRGETLLTEVIKHEEGQNQLKLLEILLKAGANPNGANTEGKTPLEVVICIKTSEYHQKIVSLLIEYGANPLRASMDTTTQKCVLKAITGYPEKLCISSIPPEILLKINKTLQSCFKEKYDSPDTRVLGKQEQTCVVCCTKEKKPTTIRLPSCGHYVHGTCLVISLIYKSKGSIRWTLPPSYIYKHIYPCCQKHIEHSFVQDLSKFYSGIQFERKDVNVAIRTLLLSTYFIHLLPLLL